MTVRLDGLQQGIANLQRLADGMPAAAKRSVRAGAAVLGQAMADRAPTLSGEMEGTLARSVHMIDDGPTAVRVGTSHGLARIFEDGGEITPSRAERLAFEGSGGLVRPGQVTMPARPFVRPAVDEATGSAVKAVERSAVRAVARLARG